MIGGITMSEKSDKLRAMLAKEKERRIKLAFATTMSLLKVSMELG